MTGRPRDEHHREGSILPFRAGASEVELSHLLFEERKLSDDTSSTSEVIPWMARLTLRLPDGVVRLPSLLGGIREKIDRLCAVDVAYSGVAVSYKANGETFAEASADSWQVCEALMAHLGIDTSAIEEHGLIRANELPIWPILNPTSLKSVSSD